MTLPGGYLLDTNILVHLVRNNDLGKFIDTTYGLSAGTETTVTIIPLRGIDPKHAAKALKKLYRDRPGFAAAALPEVGCVVIRADGTTKEEVIRLLSALGPRDSQDSAPAKGAGAK